MQSSGKSSPLAREQQNRDEVSGSEAPLEDVTSLVMWKKLHIHKSARCKRQVETDLGATTKGIRDAKDI